MVKVNLINGDVVDLDDMEWSCSISDDKLEVAFVNGKVIYCGEDARRLKAVISEHTIDPKDITPDDISHIKHVGMSFADMLRLFRGEHPEFPT